MSLDHYVIISAICVFKYFVAILDGTHYKS